MRAEGEIMLMCENSYLKTSQETTVLPVQIHMGKLHSNQSMLNPVPHSQDGGNLPTISHINYLGPSFGKWLNAQV